MKITYIFMLFCLLMLADTSALLAQRTTDMPPSRRKSLFGRELFTYRYYNFADTTDRALTRIDFHFAIINDLLSFVRNQDGLFRARYEVIVIVYDENKNAIAEQSVTNRIEEKEYSATNDRHFPHIHSLSLRLKPGFYKASIQLVDLESDQIINREEDIQVRDLSAEKLQISDPVFVNGLSIKNGVINFSPNLTNVFEDVNSAFASYVEIYPPVQTDSINLHYEMQNKNNEKIFSTDRKLAANTAVIMDTLSFRAFLKKPDEYTLLISAQQGAEQNKLHRLFQVFWGNMPLKSENLQFAIEQLALIANKSTIDSLKQVSDDAQQELFDQFWEKRDPTPNTARNELKEEFFRRVDFANQNFTEITSGRSGWQTDRGKVFIKFGPPDAVDRRETEVNVPASEVWTYSKLNRRYYFIDRNNDGVFRLAKIE